MPSRPESKPKKSSRYFYRVADTELGPFNSRDLKAEATSGRLSPDCQVRRKGDDRWHSATSIRGLFQDSPKPSQNDGPPELPAESRPKRNKDKGLFGLSKKKDKLIANLGFAAIFGVIATALIFDEDFRTSVLPWGQTENQKRVVDGKSVFEWEKLTTITTSEQSGIVYNVTLATLKNYATRPNSVRMVGGHQVEPLGCQLSETPKYQAHACTGRFRFKNALGIEDEMTYCVYFRKYEDGEIKLDDVEIDGQIVQTGR